MEIASPLGHAGPVFVVAALAALAGPAPPSCRGEDAPAPAPCGGASSGCIEGRVIDAKGRPVEGAEIVVHETLREGHLSQLRATTARTDAAGRFRIDGLTSREPVSMSAIVPDVGGYADRTVSVGAAGIELVVRWLGQIRGRVLDPDGEPAGRFSVEPRRADVPGSRPGLGLPRRRFGGGSFLYAGLPSGAWDVRVVSPRGSAVVRGVSVGELDRVAVDLGTVALVSGRRIAGRVVQAGDGKQLPIAGAAVEIAEGEEGFIDPDAETARPRQSSGHGGGFQFVGVAHEAFTLVVTHPDFVAARVPVTAEASGEDVVVALDPGATVSVLLVDSGRKPARGLRVVLAGHGGAGFHGACPADQDGVARFRGVPPGSYVAKAEPLVPGGSVAGETELEVPAGERDVSATLAVGSGG